VLKFALRSTQPAEVLRALKELLEQLASEEIHQMA
jgi:hypothetical protein